MLTAYIFCLAVGGGFLVLSLFGDVLESEVDFDADLDIDVDAHGADFAKLLSLRTVVYALFGFGATGAALHALWGGGQGGITAAIAGVTGVASGALISTMFRYLKRTEAGAKLGEQSFIGLSGEVSLPIAPESLGAVRVQRGDRRYRIRARLDSTSQGSEAIQPGRAVVVVDIENGVASVAPVEMELLED